MLYFIPTPIGNLEDISQRALSLLCEIEYIFCEDTRICKSLLDKLIEKYNLKLSDKKLISFHSHNEKDILKDLDKKILEKKCGFLTDAGMPCVSDPGASLVRFCQENNLSYEVLPGANALLLAYASSGFEGEFCFFGFLPHKKNARDEKLNQIINSPFISILYESPHRIQTLIEELNIKVPFRKAFLIKEASKKFHNHFFGTIEQIKTKLECSNLKGEWVLVLNKNENSKNLLTNLENEILNLDISPKQKAKILSKISNESSKDWYQKIIKNK